MHEMSLINDLLAKINTIAEQNNASRINKATVRLGALSHISADHFREHFVDGTRGSIAEGAELKVEMSDDVNDPHAQDIILLSVDIEEKTHTA